MKDRVEVKLRKDGKWAVINTLGERTVTLFDSKIDAVEAAWNMAPDEQLIIRTATGEVMPYLDVTPSIDPRAVKDAILRLARQRAEEEKSEG